VTRRILFRGLPLILVLASIAFVLDLSHQAGLLDKAGIDAYVRGRGLTGELLFVLLGAAFTAVGVPRQLVCFLGGYGFGLVLGGLLALGATVLGCCASFGVARVVGGAWVVGRMSKRIRALQVFIHDNTFTTTLLVRFLPLGNNLLTNLAAGAGGVRAMPFLAGSTLGFAPQTLMFSLLGSGETLDPAFRSVLAILLFFGSGLMGVQLFGRYRRHHRGAPEVERELDAELEAIPEAPARGGRTL